MNSTSLYEAFRSDVVDTARPYLWTDDEVWRYMDAAYRMFVRLTGGVHDFTSDVTRIDVVAGEATSQQHECVLKTEQAFLLSNGRELSIVNWADQPMMQTADYNILRQLYMDNRPGPVQYMVIGSQRNIVKWVQIPQADDVVQTQIYRLPIERITGEDQEFVDVVEDHHTYFLDWMEHLAYKKQDAETFDKGKSKEKEQNFRTYCAQCKAEWEKYKHKTRVVAYGGL